MSISVDPTLGIGAFNAARSGAMFPITLQARSDSFIVGPVGIGLTNPSGAKLHVNGNVKINSTRAIVGWASGTIASGTTNGTASFGLTFPSPPVVVAMMHGQSDVNLVTCVMVSSVTTTGFNYRKTYAYAVATTAGQNGNGTVSWFAVLLA